MALSLVTWYKGRKEKGKGLESSYELVFATVPQGSQYDNGHAEPFDSIPAMAARIAELYWNHDNQVSFSNNGRSYVHIEGDVAIESSGLAPKAFASLRDEVLQLLSGN